MAHFSPQTLAMLTYACGVLGTKSARLMGRLMDAARTHIGEFKDKELVALACAAARLRFVPEDAFVSRWLEAFQARALTAEFMSNLARATRRDPHELMAEIFNNLDRSTENRMMAALEGVSDDSASRIRQLMFTFEDLKRLDANGIPVLLRAVEKDKLAIALKGASEQLRELFLRGMSERAGRMLRDDIAALGPVRLKDVEEAQAIIVALAKDLSQQGALRLTDGGQEMMVE